MKKVLIANRGEIAVRIIRACHDLGLATVAVYSLADQEALHVLLADEAVCIGEPQAAKSYLKISNILAACEITGADAVHPGYGFLSENANFASICESCGLTFIGPSSESIATMGDKIAAKQLAKKVKCPVIPGSEGIIKDEAEGLKIAEKIGFPIVIKAVAGGGGRGIRIVKEKDEFFRAFSAARAEAEAGFNNPNVYIEKFIENPRHLEVQILGDKHGNYVHLGERDCTVQRRRQKLIEETPSPILTPELRAKVGKVAVDLARSANYHSVGTVEFLLDKDKKFYFMEMNTRIQVEHTITEEVTGIDLLKEQIYVAVGNKLTWKQKNIVFKGHVIQCRINAEDPSNNFAPSPGRLDYYLPPAGPSIRLDGACYSGYAIPPYYDSMIAKVISKGKNREEAIAIMKRALKEFHIGGVHSTIPFHQFMLDNPKFINSDYDINYVDHLLSQGNSLF
ncbi:acetyl-CoA carboxylase biotin carboxylase subunit [Chlamydia psittaci]|uniref:acetyl-CoA carboxylase biotin carboxylase subunit n=1 Tax=Chlamydia psittaci TaxID=83554 RepID=UPI00027E1244|nr:acetyl-CoA carboxylase biotin carboxylase subunit [Chlamydia psittaci]EPJ24734.1 acetyl-CoA carboxylase, biotin carboxylase subunit [Chlamydia psittaci 09DC77]EPJ29614.1 acetyl-CoA carboxylase, biotin carboxylase subunit [Chlamydia psittaci 09DC78]EPL01247.1 acetyl-CoA carboxylase, biotin carboxylase subunit [Chlamydia psittaci 09DC79]AFS21489.1 acetyl-CoA carboxylase, biotin carboxylase [Chlamydia psittaci MN]AFS27038.1 acetyl-CoA carboxylase, biotin carboxylase [Chlamydia psittaci CP3]